MGRYLSDGGASHGYLVGSPPRATSGQRVKTPKNVYLAPSSAPKVNRATVMRAMSPDAARALMLRNRVGSSVAKVERRINPQDNGGILGMITAPFRVGGEVLGNAVGELGQIIPGTARFAFEGLKNTAQAVTGPIPGAPWSGREALGRLANMGIGTVNALGDDIRFVGKPIAQGDLVELARRVKNQPLRVASTAMLAYPLAGAAVSAGLKGGEIAARASGATRVAQRLEHAGSKRTVPVKGKPVPRRYREPEVIPQPRVDAHGREVVPSSGPIERPRRPRSSNPITREIQIAVNDRIVKAIRQGAGAVPVRVRGKNINPMSPAARFNRIVAKDVRNEGTDFIARMENDAIRGSQDFQKIIRSLPRSVGGKKNARAVHYTAAIRAMGLNNLGKTHTSRTWGRDRLIKIYEESLKKNENPLYADHIKKNIEVLKSIPDHWLDPVRAPKPINDLTGASIDLLRKSTDIKLSTGLLNPETASASGRRAQAEVAGVGAEYAGFRDAVRKQQAAAAAAATAKGEIDGLTSKIAKLETRISASKSGPKKSELANVESLKERLNVAQYNFRVSQRKSAKNAAKAKRYHKKVGKVLDWEMKPGEYFPNVRGPEAGIKGRKRIGRPIGKESPRTTPAKEFRNRGIILRDGTAAFGPEVTLNAFKNALDLHGRQRAIEAMLTKYVVKDSNGVPITNDAAVKMAESSNDLYVARSKEHLLRTFAEKDMQSPAAKALRDAIKETDGDTKYLIPKSFETGWRQALAPNKTWFDNMNAYWKAGVLALSPRWYIQNMVGMWSQFALGAGLDLQAIKMARSPKYLDAVIAEIEGHGLSSDLGEFVRRESGREARGVVRRVVEFGYKWNSKFESIPRRAMYWNSVKKKLSQEEMAKRGASSAELADAWLNVANAAKRGEKWADDLIDQVRLETERFMGNYTRYNNFERTILRRAFPFYGWMRAIHRLAFALPVKYPKRTALLMVASRMAYEMYNDKESSLMDPIAGIVIGTGTFMGTGSSSIAESLTSTARLGKNVARQLQTGDFKSIPGEIAAAAWQQANPLVTAIPTIAMNQTPLGTPLNFGAGGDVYTDKISGKSFAIDPRTGELVPAENRLGPEQAVLRNFPWYNLAKRGLAGGAPTDSAGIGELLAWNLKGRPANEAPGLVRSGRPEGQTLSKDWRYDVTNAIGFPLYRYSPRNTLIDSIRDAEAKKRAYEAALKDRIKNQLLYERIGVR